MYTACMYTGIHRSPDAVYVYGVYTVCMYTVSMYTACMITYEVEALFILMTFHAIIGGMHIEVASNRSIQLHAMVNHTMAYHKVVCVNG